MGADFPAVVATLKTGLEQFTSNGRPADFSVLDFWSWSTSDFLSNITRGVLAEFLVAKALGITAIRSEWSPHDLETDDGLKIEVKCSAYIQSWHQKKLSKPTFGIARTRKWDREKGAMAPDASRSADVYVFALFTPQDMDNAEPLNLDLWHFHVLHIEEVEAYTRSQHSITVTSLRRVFGEPCRFEDLGKAIHEKSKRATQ